MDDNLTKLKKCISLIVEDLGHLSRRTTRGYGANHPIYVGAGKEALGGQTEKHETSPDEEKGTPVKISKAFLK